jgi:hypothetical protein
MLLLDGRTLHGTEGTENAAVPWIGTQQSFTVGALMKNWQASVGMLSLLSSKSTMRARQD